MGLVTAHQRKGELFLPLGEKKYCLTEKLSTNQGIFEVSGNWDETRINKGLADAVVYGPSGVQILLGHHIDGLVDHQNL